MYSSLSCFNITRYVPVSPWCQHVLSCYSFQEDVSLFSLHCDYQMISRPARDSPLFLRFLSGSLLPLPSLRLSSSRSIKYKIDPLLNTFHIGIHSMKLPTFFLFIYNVPPSFHTLLTIRTALESQRESLRLML